MRPWWQVYISRVTWGLVGIVVLFMAVGAPFITWSVAAVVGAAFSFRGLMMAYGNLVAVHTLKKNGPNELVARQGVRNEAFRVAKQGIAIALAVASIVNGRDFGVLIIAGLVLIQVLTSIASVLDRRDDTRLLEMVGVLEPTDHS